jgi:hypothetical protein
MFSAYSFVMWAVMVTEEGFQVVENDESGDSDSESCCLAEPL